MARNNRASRYAAPIGGVFIILCLIGLVTLIAVCFQFTQGLLDNTNAKHEYEAKLIPVLMFDPPPFEDPQTLRDADLLMYSVWAAVFSDKQEIYEYDDNLSMIIPASDVEMAAYQLFGPSITLTHSTFGDYENTYLYDETTKSYHVPVMALTGFYTPRVDEIVKKGDVITLTVGYIPPINALNVSFGDSGGLEREPDKYMLYVLNKDKDNYFLYAIRDVEGGGIVIDGLTGEMANDMYNENDPNVSGNIGEPADQLNLLPQSSSSEPAGSTADQNGGDGASSAEDSSGTPPQDDATQGDEPAADGGDAESQPDGDPPPDGESSSGGSEEPLPEIQG